MSDKRYIFTEFNSKPLAQARLVSPLHRSYYRC